MLGQFISTEKRPNWLIFLFLISLSACTSPEKLIYQGRYDDAVDLAVKKLSGKKKKDTHILQLENAFQKATDSDMGRITFLKKEGEPDNWEEINRIANRIGVRQNKVKRVLPLFVASQGDRAAEFTFVNVDELILESKEKAAAYLYARAEQLLELGETGDKKAAREAYEELEKTKKYYSSYRDRISLMKKAKDLGTNHILFQMVNNSQAFLPAGFENELLRISVNRLNEDWVTYHLYKDDDVRYDLDVIVNLQRLEISPERYSERSYTESKEIEDGTEYVLDENGNVAKDSSGNDITIPAYRTISANVLETQQFKAALVSGRLEYIHRETGNLLLTVPINTEAVFENFAATFEGDRRALTDETARKIGNRPVPFPTDPQLLLTAAEVLKDNVKDLLYSNRRFARKTQF